MRIGPSLKPLPALQLSVAAQRVKHTLDVFTARVQSRRLPGGESREEAFARELLFSLGAPSSLADARRFLAEPGVVAQLQLFADLWSSAGTYDERAAIAQRAFRAGLMSGAVKQPDLVARLGPLALADACAKDLGYTGVTERDGRLYADGAELGPTGMSPPQLGVALSRARYGCDRVVPPHSPVEPHAKGFSEANGVWAANLSQLAYRDEASVRRQLEAWGFDLSTFSFISDPATGTRAFVVAAPDGTVFTSFRGTADAAGAFADAQVCLKSPAWAPDVEVHSGMAGALDASWLQLEAALQKARGGRSDAPVIFTGHSLGGGMTQLAALRAVRSGLVSGQQTQVYPVAAPRSGNADFAKAFAAELPRTFRLVNFDEGEPIDRQDLVTQLPLQAWGYRHVGSLVRLGEGSLTQFDPTDPRSRAAPAPGEEATAPNPAVEAMSAEQIRAALAPQQGVTVPSTRLHESNEYVRRIGEATSRPAPRFSFRAWLGGLVREQIAG